MVEAIAIVVLAVCAIGMAVIDLMEGRYRYAVMCAIALLAGIVFGLR